MRATLPVGVAGLDGSGQTLLKVHSSAFHIVEMFSAVTELTETPKIAGLTFFKAGIAEGFQIFRASFPVQAPVFQSLGGSKGRAEFAPLRVKRTREKDSPKKGERQKGDEDVLLMSHELARINRVKIPTAREYPSCQPVGFRRLLLLVEVRSGDVNGNWKAADKCENLEG